MTRGNETLSNTVLGELPENVSMAPAHQAVRELIDALREQGTPPRGMLALIRRQFPHDYQRTHAAWRQKISNATRDNVHVGQCFRCFPDFLYQCGWKPVSENTSYQIHQIQPGEGYFLGNVKWLDQTNNLIYRGDSARVREYAEFHDLSRSTAYRHLRKEKIVEFENILKGKLNIAEQLHVTWYKTLNKYHPDACPTIPHSTTTSLKKLSSFSDEWGYRLLTNDTIERIVSNWQAINAAIKYGYDNHCNLGEIPTLRKLKAHIEYIGNALNKVEADKIAKEKAEIAKQEQEAKAEKEKLKAYADHKAMREQALQQFKELTDNLSGDDIEKINTKWAKGCQYIKGIRPEDVIYGKAQIATEYVYLLLQAYQGTIPDSQESRPKPLDHKQLEDLQVERALWVEPEWMRKALIKSILKSHA